MRQSQPRCGRWPLTPTGARPVEAMRDLRREDLVAIRGAGAWMAKARVTIRPYPITASDREVVMARSQVRQSEALRKARERQRELDKEEDQRREALRVRVAEASAHAIVALERRADGGAGAGDGDERGR